MQVDRVFLVVLDSFGIGAAEDAAHFGDAGANTLRSISLSPAFCADTLARLGLASIEGCEHLSPVTPIGLYAKLVERGAGKDTVTGHWELAGVRSTRPMPLYPNGFPDEILRPFTERTGRGVLCNLPYSGTEVLRDYGERAIREGKFIVYTSGDSVFQIAAHEEHIPLAELYRACEIARELLCGVHAVGRVIARPFVGTHPFTRTANRHDYALPPPHPTMLNALQDAGLATIGVGKIGDIFAGSGIGESIRTQDNADGMQKLAALTKRDFRGLCFVNLVDFDAKYGHRNDVNGYAGAIAAFDRFLCDLLPMLGEKDLLLITADHGCDPAYPGTDHTREHVPLLGYAKGICLTSIGTRSFADLGATICDLFHVPLATEGVSFADAIRLS